MFSVTTEQRQYSTVVLRDEATQAQLEIVPERGGIATRWAIADTEIFYLDTERFANPELSVRGGNPILFPICGNLPDDTYQLDGQTYQLKQHGFARTLPWQVVKQSTDGRASVTLRLESTEETRSHYPFDCQIRFTYTLQGTTFTLHQQVINQSKTSMPFGIGLHPYFQVSDKDKLQFDIPAQAFQTKSGEPFDFSGDFDFSQDEIDVLFADLSAQATSVIDPVKRTKLTIDFSDPYTVLVFWTVKGKDFYCLEPWSTPRNAMNTGDRLSHLAPGNTFETTVRFHISALA
ncbi:MAG: aldose epimerase [Cyanobacteria bacterium J06638_22]